MQSTTIHFNEKQEFSTILKVIEQNFKVISMEKSQLSNIFYIGFEYEGENIYCYYSRDNKIYYNDGRLLHCSTLSSDRLSSLKDKAFTIIASQFDCKLWLNDHDENSFTNYTLPKANDDDDFIWVMIEEVTYYDDTKSLTHHHAKKIEVLHEKAKDICKRYNLHFAKSNLPQHEFIFADGESVHFGIPDKSEENPDRKNIRFSCFKKNILQ